MMMTKLDPYLLIVDDQPEICRLLAYCLKDEGFTIRMTLNGEQAIRAICIQKPALGFRGISDIRRLLLREWSMRTEELLWS